MSLPLLKYTTRSNWIIGLIFLVIMLFYLATIVSMYNPEDIESLNAMLDMMPEELVAVMRLDAGITDLTSFLGAYYYSFLIFLFPMIFCIIVGNRLVARHVDSGSMAYLLSTPNSRIRVVTTQAVCLIAGVVLLIGLVGLAGLGIGQAMFPGELDVAMFIRLNAGAILCFVAVSSICFVSSCLFDDTKYSVALGAGIPVLFFVVNMLANVGGSPEWLRYLTLYSLYDPALILAGEQSVAVNGLIFLGIAAVLYGAGVLAFDRRDLPL